MDIERLFYSLEIRGVKVDASVTDPGQLAEHLIDAIRAARPQKPAGPGCDCMADPAAVADPELTAMTVAVACLEPLDMEAQARVMHWLIDRFHVDL